MTTASSLQRISSNNLLGFFFLDYEIKIRNQHFQNKCLEIFDSKYYFKEIKVCISKFVITVFENFIYRVGHKKF
jgi:hypothetical protein